MNRWMCTEFLKMEIEDLTLENINKSRRPLKAESLNADPNMKHSASKEAQHIILGINDLFSSFLHFFQCFYLHLFAGKKRLWVLYFKRFISLLYP